MLTRSILLRVTYLLSMTICASLFGADTLVTAPTASLDTRQLAKVIPPASTNSLINAVGLAAAQSPEKIGPKELLELLTQQLDPGREGDELELQLTQDWKPISVPSDPIDLRILDKPATGLNARFSVRFEIRSGDRSLGSHTAHLLARLYREVWVARSPVKIGTSLNDADLVKERRDVIGRTEPTWSGVSLDSTYRVAQSIAAGNIVLDRAIQLRPVIFRNKSIVQAVVRDGALTISTMAEPLEDGAPNQIIRARTLRTKKEIQGRVIDAKTIEVVL